MSTTPIFKRKVDKQIIADWVLASLTPFPLNKTGNILFMEKVSDPT